MSERIKLEAGWKARMLLGEHLSPAAMIVELGKLVEKCPHDKTHWVQEILENGEFSPLLKRCYLCGFNIDELKAKPEFIEQLLADFDAAVEKKRQEEPK